MWQRKRLEFNIPGELASVLEQLISYCIFYVNPPYSVDTLILLLSYRHTWTIPSQAFFPAWDLPKPPDQAAYVWTLGCFLWVSSLLIKTKMNTSFSHVGHTCVLHFSFGTDHIQTRLLAAILWRYEATTRASTTGPTPECASSQSTWSGSPSSLGSSSESSTVFFKDLLKKVWLIQFNLILKTIPL